MTGDLRPLVAEAVRRFGHDTPLFTSLIFAEVVWDEFNLYECPADKWACNVLAQLGYVTRRSATIYRYHDEATR